MRLTCTDLEPGFDVGDRPSGLSFGKTILDKAKENGVDFRGEPHGSQYIPMTTRYQEGSSVIGNELEFQKLHDVFRPRILRYMRRMVGEGAAEDLTQDVFVKVNNALGSFRGESQVSTWIYKIATRTALDRLRSVSAQRTVAKGSPQDPFARVEVELESRDAWTGEKTPAPDAALVRKEMNECIRGFIEQLPPDYRTALVLSELEELKNTEIADVLGVTLDTVKIRLHRARARLKKELAAHCKFYHDDENELACDLKDAMAEFRKNG